MLPWYRSRLLWLGLPGLLFLLWLFGGGFTLTWVRAGDELKLSAGNGKIRGTHERYMVSRSEPFGVFWLRPTGFYVAPHVEGAGEDFGIPEAARIESVRGATWATSVIIAVWLLLLLYLVVWLSLFGLSQRRKARMLKTSTDNP